MSKRKILHLPGTCHFVTFSTHQRRRLLDSPETRGIVTGVLQEKLISQRGKCAGYVIMPNHVHALLHGEEGFNISAFIQVWKKTSSYRIKRFFAESLSNYAEKWPKDCPVWQPRFYDFNVDSDRKMNEKLDYMHHNPIEAKLCEYAHLWQWSSARFYQMNEIADVTITPMM